MTPTSPIHQTVRLGRGRHHCPKDGMCVMELASRLAGERFSDRPAAVCPVLAGFLRGYNDGLPDDARHAALIGWAAHVVGTRDLRSEVLDERTARIEAFAHRALPWSLTLRLAFAGRGHARIGRCEEIGLQTGRWVGTNPTRRAAVDALLADLCGVVEIPEAVAPDLARVTRRDPDEAAALGLLR